MPLGTSSRTTSRLAYGCWRVAGTWNPSEVTDESRAAGRRAMRTAYETGYTLFDNADIYCHGEAERLLGEVLREIPGMREHVIVATKGGIRRAATRPRVPPRAGIFQPHTSSPPARRRSGAWVSKPSTSTCCTGPDFLADPGEIAKAFSQLKSSGKVRFFGVSNFRPTLVTAVQAACPMPLVAHQVEISLAKLDAFTDGTLDQCLIEGLTPMAWSPLASGLLGAGAKLLLDAQKTYRPEAFLPVLDAIATAREVSRVVIALAWLLKHPSRIQPIVGSTNPERIREAAQATSVELTREEWYRLLVAAQGKPLP